MAQQLQRYDLVHKVAAGGMGEVYLGRARGEHGFQKTVAVKRILPELARDAAFVTRFIDEAKLTVSLAHANIVQVLDLGKSGDELLLIMEFVHGIDARQLLEALVRAGQPAPQSHVVYIATRALEALAYAHSRGVVHLDVSPSNLLLSYEGEVKLADFGVAQALELVRQRCAGGAVVGKLRYMPPEQLRGDALDARADLYALGVVVYELLTATRPFGDGDAATVERVRPPRPVAELRPDVPAELALLVERMLARRAADRPADARSLLSELAQVARQLEPVTGPELGLWVRGLCPPRLDPYSDRFARVVADLVGRPASRTATAAPSPSPTMSYVLRGSVAGVSVLERREAGPRRRRVAVAVAAGALGVALAAAGTLKLMPRLSLTARAASLAPSPADTHHALPLADAAHVAPASVAVAAPAHNEPAAPRRAQIHREKASSQRGFLNVYAEPWAYVFVDGRRVGSTPLGRFAVEAGTRHVRLVAKGRAPLDRTVEIAPGETKLVSVQLP